MDSLLLTCPSSDVTKLITRNRNSFLVSSANGYYSSWSSSSQKASLRRLKLRTQVIVSAAKKENNNNKNKVDKHSFVPKQDEATGLFPEAVLLKEVVLLKGFISSTPNKRQEEKDLEKKVQEDGKLLPEFADAEEQELFEALTLQLESDLDVDRMRHYEVVYLIHENHKEEVESVNEKVQEFIKEKKGRIWRFSDWGMRRLAYKIQKAKNAHYILMNFEVEAKWINDFKTMLDKDERVIRHLVIKRDKAETEECPPPPEFNTLRADMEDNDEDDVYDDEDDEEINAASYEGEADGIIYVDDDEDDDRVKESKGRRKQKMEVAR